MKFKITNFDCLILVDIQNDFCTGSLAVPDALDIIEPANEYINLFQANNRPIVATRDWHPKNHSSFKDFGGIWPIHCVQGSFGSGFYDKIRFPNDTIIISKAISPEEDAYSGFDDTCLDKKLKILGIKRLFIGGLATDYCVKETIIDALRLNYTTFFLSDCSKAVNLNKGDEMNSIEQMMAMGTILIELKDFLIF